MAGNGLNLKDINEIKRLWKLGLKKREIARITKVHRNTVSKYVDEFNSEINCARAAVKIVTPQICSNWTVNVDWENVRSEYLRGAPLNIIHEEII